MPRKCSIKRILTCILAVSGMSLAQVHAAIVTKDAVNSHTGALMGASAFTLDAGGHSGKAGDRAIDLGMNVGYVYVEDAAFLNELTKNDEMTFTMWIKKYDIANSWAFSANAASVTGGPRAFSGHVPWGDGSIYFDTAGCCDGTTQRINANIDTFPDYTGDVTWWNSWRHYAFSKKGEIKQVWIDGKLFMEGTSTAPLPIDYTVLYIAASATGTETMHGLIDDFAIFGTALTEQSINQLKNGTAPTALPASAKLSAYWAFDDIPSDGIFTSTLPAPNSGSAVPNLIKVVHMDGASAWDTNKVSLKVDNTPVPATVIKDGVTTTVTYVPSPIFAMQTAHKAALVYPSADGTQKTYEWDFMVGAYTKDSVKSYIGALEGAAKYTTSGGGQSGKAGDFAIDLGATQAGQAVHITDVSFLNEAAANDEMAVAGWQKLYSIRDSAFFWGVSPSSNGSQRGWGTHTPWSNNNFYFDTAGCCDTSTQRVSDTIDNFPDYTGDVGWWTNWHHFVFQKKGSTKEIWIDGKLFLQGDSTAVLPTDFSEAYIGFDPADNARLQGLLDDMAVFKTALTEANIGKLVNRTSTPKDLPGVVAYWDFNDLPAEGIFTSISPSPYATDALPNQIKVTHMDGNTPWDTTKVSLKVNNAPVQANVTKAGNIVTISYVPSPIFAPLTAQKAAVVYSDAAGTQKSFEWPFTVLTYVPVQDTLHNYFGMLRQAAKFTPDAGGHTAKAGDYALDIGTAAGSVYVPDASWANEATAKDEMTVAFWTKKYDTAASMAFWFNSPSSADTSRGFQAHIPWSDNVIYFDTGGAGTGTRISAGIDTFLDYTGDISYWTNNWHYIVLTKKADMKQIWIDGKLFLEGGEAIPLKTDFTSLYIGADGTGASPMHALIDDFAVFATALTEANVNALFKGTSSPKDLASAKPIAYWDFNTLPVVTPNVPTLKLERSANGLILTFEGGLQSADGITGPWTDMTGASPLTVTPSGTGKYFRAKR